ncbi:PspA-associated protein PspAA [Actinomadura kijaniata]|uniref:PspA-associated protein PspAA n=1 Tax=Actinomadura kijaniata TaxID=46161 RepID=UPI003F1BFB46
MIVRIMSEGQFDVAPADLAALNALDDALEAAIESGDEATFRRALHALLDDVRRVGKELPPDSLEPSELILPPSDADIEEVRQMLGDSGLIPD